jgi:hypothetical protein
MRLVTANQATAAKRRVYFHLVDVTDGLTAETGEAGGQPQVSTNGGAWTNTGIGTLTAIGNGRYYADLTQTLVATTGDVIETRYKSANTAECPGDSVQVVAIDVDNAVTLGLSSLPNATAGALNGLPLSADTAGRVDVIKINGTSQTARDIGASVLLSPGTGTGQVNLALGRVGINWGDVTNQSTVVNLSSTTISTSQAIGSVSGAVGSVTANVTVGGYAAGQAPLQPTVAGRTLDVTTTGEAGIDWANIGSPTSTVGLTNTTISTSQVVASVSGAVGSVTGNVGGNVVGSVASVTGNVGGNVVGSVASVTGNVGGNVVGSVASVTGNVGGNVTGSVGSVSNPASIWNALTSGLTTVGSIGKLLVDNVNATISSRSTLAASDVWNALTSGLTTVGSIGKLLVDNVNATISSRSTLTASDVWTNATRTLTSFGTLATDVWAVATRTLTSGTNIVLAKGTGVTGFNDLDAAGVRSAVGLASANLDTQLAALPSAATTASAVWEEPMSGHTGSTTYGGRIVRATNSNVTVQITGSQHISADVHDLQPAVINNTHFAAGAIDSNALATNAAQEIADAVLGRNIAGGSSTGRTVTEALRFLRNKFTVSGTSLTVYQEDDTTVSWTSTVSTSATADPITGSDPA